MTTLNVTLTSTMQDTLGSPGAYAYAVYFDADGTPNWTRMVDNGAVNSSGTYAIDLPFPYNGGKVYFLVQSQDPSATQTDLTTLITEQSDINWGNADTYQYRYDSFEVSLLGASGDAGNLTSVQGFGLPMELSIAYADGTVQTRSYAVSGSDIFTDVGDISSSSSFKYSDGPLSGTNRAAISPSEAVGLNPPNTTFQASDWVAYIDTLKVAEPGAVVSGFFNGAKDGNGIYHNGGFFGYQLEWSATDAAFWLNPLAESQIKGSIKLTPDALANSIYSTLGNVEIYANRTDATPYTLRGASSAEMNTGANNQWGEVLTQFLTGFTGGYYGTEGVSLNADVTETIDLSKNWNWDPTYAFGQNLSGDAAPFDDPYSEIFFVNSNSYGSGYSDNLMDAYAQGGPLIPVSETVGGVTKNVDTIDLTIYDDSETPSGYTVPVIYNYIAPPGHQDFGLRDLAENSYTPAVYTDSGPNITLNFFNQNAVLKADTTLQLEIFDGMHLGVPIFRTIEFKPQQGQGLWQNWQITENPAHSVWSANAVPDTEQMEGSLVISNLPTPETGVGWYRITVGSGDAAKTFNLYTETQDNNFVNPGASGQAGSLAIDGLALIAPETSTEATISTFAVNFMYSGSTTLDPSLFAWNSNTTHVSTLVAPTTAVAGTLAADEFTALGGQTGLVTNTITTDKSNLAFGWTGTNSDPNTSSWISGLTNKIGAENLVQIGFAGGAGSLAPIHAVADIDGQWQSAVAKALGNGTYTITFAEHLAAGANVGAQVGHLSDSLTLTVDVADLGLDEAEDNQGLLIDPAQSGANGNWVEFKFDTETADTGQTVLFYVVDADGALVGRDGETGDHVTLEQATRGALGAITDDAGATLALGSQSIYLATDQEVRFALLTGENDVDRDVQVTLTETGSNAFDISLGDLTLSAQTNNTLSDAAVLADAQRQNNLPLVHLDQGAAVDVMLSGSTSVDNMLGFIRVEVGLDGSLSLNGTAFDNSAAFRENVRMALDDNFTASFTGSTAETSTWTVAGESGYYAPILMSGDENLFVVGSTNIDDMEHIRLFGENTFGFEDITAADGADFDYNDVVVNLALSGTASSLDWLV